MGSPHPGAGEPEQRGKDGGGAVVLGEQDDGGVAGGVEDEADKVGRCVGEGCLEWWYEQGVGREEVEAV